MRNALLVILSPLAANKELRLRHIFFIFFHFFSVVPEMESPHKVRPQQDFGGQWPQWHVPRTDSGHPNVVLSEDLLIYWGQQRGKG